MGVLGVGVKDGRLKGEASLPRELLRGLGERDEKQAMERHEVVARDGARQIQGGGEANCARIGGGMGECRWHGGRGSRGEARVWLGREGCLVADWGARVRTRNAGTPRFMRRSVRVGWRHGVCG